MLTQQFGQGSNCNFAGIIGDNLFKIEGGILRHLEFSRDPLYLEECGFHIKPMCIGFKRQTITIELDVSRNGFSVFLPNEDCTDLNIRDKFVSQCSIEELLVAVQAKLNGM